MSIGRPFKKGQSGNPGGRPKVVAEVNELARAHTAEAIETLVSIMTNPKSAPAARVSAANALWIGAMVSRPSTSPARTPTTSHYCPNDAKQPTSGWRLLKLAERSPSRAMKSDGRRDSG
jgi:Family of unknown function (DUF5681)